MNLFPKQFGLRSLLIFSLKETPRLPYEFTVAGMLERLNAYLEHQVNAHCKFTLLASSSLYSVSLIRHRRSWRAVVWSYLLSKPVIETEFQHIRISPLLVIQKNFCNFWRLIFRPKFGDRYVTHVKNTVKLRLTVTSLLRPLFLAVWQKPRYSFV